MTKQLTDEQRALVEENIGLAKKTAGKEFKRYKIFPYEEILSTCYYGLTRAVQNFDPAQGFKFSTYAVATMKGFVKQEVMPRKPQIPALYLEEIFNYDNKVFWGDFIPDTKSESTEDTAILNIITERIEQEINACNFQPIAKKILFTRIANPDLNQTQVGKMLGCSQATVYRALKAAKERFGEMVI